MDAAEPLDPDQLPELLFHWTEQEDSLQLVALGFKAGVYLTADGRDPNEYWNEDIFWLKQPTRLTIDVQKLDPSLFVHDPWSGEDTENPSFGTHGNAHYKGEIPPSAIVAATSFFAPRSWKMDR